MVLPGRTHKDQRKHRRKVARDPEKGLIEHLKREQRRGPGRPKTPIKYRDRRKPIPVISPEEAHSWTTVK